MRRGRTLVAVSGGAALFAAHRQVFRITQRPSWPPPADAVTAAGAEAATRTFIGRDPVGTRDATLQFAWSTAATIEPWVDGANFFPRILADIESARSSVHILMFGWREGEIGTRMASLLESKLAEGVAVRVIVDGVGSRPYLNARGMFSRLAAAGAEIVVNDMLPPTRKGTFPDGQRLTWSWDETGRADHRKLYVVDGVISWTGGAGVEDHFNDGRFHDVMVRVTGDVVRQAQATFLTSFHAHGGPPPGDLSPLFPEPPENGSTPIVLAQVIPGGFVAASQAIGEQIDAARERLDVINPYLTDRDMIDRIIAAARRGVSVRVLVSQRSNNFTATAALRHRYADLAAAGAEVWEVPDTVVHAKVVVADDIASFGTVNLDAWALYRNSEIMMMARSRETAELLRERLFEPDIARSGRGEPPSGTIGRLVSRVCDRLTYYL